jgi:hypothetical protein
MATALYFNWDKMRDIPTNEFSHYTGTRNTKSFYVDTKDDVLLEDTITVASALST